MLYLNPARNITIRNSFKLSEGIIIMNTENTLSESQIAEWKKKYGKVYKTVVGDDVLVWRKIKRSEYIKAMTEIDEEDTQVKIYLRQDFITKTATLYPDNIEELIEENGGLSLCMADQIMSKSGFDITATSEL